MVSEYTHRTKKVKGIWQTHFHYISNILVYGNYFKRICLPQLRNINRDRSGHSLCTSRARVSCNWAGPDSPIQNILGLVRQDEIVQSNVTVAAQAPLQSQTNIFSSKPQTFGKVPFLPINWVTVLGTSLVLHQSSNNVSLSNLRKTTFGPGPIKAVVKRRKEHPFDNVIQRDKKLKLVLKIWKILVSQPDRIMSLRKLGKYRRELGLDKK
ncbi:hypothetical protein SO802_019721 [Lithocarpus litseifolius]|uniref:PORR domain-containing protein n=1 Tax=Lithocarpus litseifolius TaxID=425828 RepID=A0AAW2CPY9_9ROSI